MSFVAQTPQERAAFIEQAHARDQSIIEGNNKLLQLDCDNIDSYNLAVDQIQNFHTSLNIKRIFLTRSRGWNYHIYIQLETPINQETRILWQAVLGSDRRREGLTYMGIEAGYSFEAFLLEEDGATFTPILTHLWRENQ